MSTSSEKVAETQTSYSATGWQLQELSLRQVEQINEAYSTPDDHVLLDAWRLLIALDQEAVRQKISWIRLRNLALNLSFIMLLLATLAAWIAPVLTINPVSISVLGQLVPTEALQAPAIILKLMLVMIPLVITVIVAFTSEFTSTPVWIVYRQQVEALRREIYLYRQLAGSYQLTDENTLRTNQLRLGSRIEATFHAVNEYQERAPFAQNYYKLARQQDTVSLVAKIAFSDDDNGFGALAPDIYVKTRIELQQRWYAEVVARNLAWRRKWRVVTLTLTALATLGVAIGIEYGWLIIVVNAFVSYINARNTLYDRSDYVKGYALALQNLEILVTSWRALFEEERYAAYNVNLLIVRAEEILSQEGNTVFQQMMKTMFATESILGDAISNLTGNRVTADSVQAFSKLAQSPTVTVESVKDMAATITRPDTEH